MATRAFSSMLMVHTAGRCPLTAQRCGRRPAIHFQLAGPNASVDLSAVDGVTVTNSTIEALAGNSAAYGGGSANVNISSYPGSGAVSITGSTLRATGGSGVPGWWSGDGNVNVAADGYGGTVGIDGSLLSAIGGSGGGTGGWADVHVNSDSGTTIANSIVQAIGGAGEPGYMQGGATVGFHVNSSGNLTISNSTVSAQGGYYADVHMDANGGVTISNSTVSATAPAADGGEGYVGIQAYNGNVDTGSSTVSAAGSAEGGEGGTSVYIYASNDVNLGLVTSSQYVNVNAGGAINDGNAGLNIGALDAYLSANNGVGSVANPLETQVAMLDVYTNTGGIGIINSGDLAIYSAYAGSGDVAIGTTGSLAIVDGGEGVANGGNLSLGANGHLGIYGNVYASGNLFLQSGGDMEIGNTGAYYTGSAMGGTGATAVAGGSLTLNPNMYMDPSFLGSYGGNTTVTTGGNVTVNNSFISGNPDVMMTVGGVVNINGTSEFPGGIEADVPLTIYLTFPKGLSGGYFINGIEGVVYDPATGTGFIAGGNPAILGTNLKVTYNGIVPTLSPPTDTLIVAMGESTKPPDPDKDKDIFKEQEDEEKKNAPVCR